MDHFRKELLSRITSKGGVFGTAAGMYLDDPVKGNHLLREFFEQAHNKSLWDHWGVELTLDVIQYRVKFLRSQYNHLKASELQNIYL